MRTAIFAGAAGALALLTPEISSTAIVSISPARHFVMFDQPEKFSATLDQALVKVYE
jgi:hypothetical protein